MKATKITSLILAVMLVALSVATLTVLPAAADTWDGSSTATTLANGKGTEAEPYLIGSAAELAYLSAAHTTIKAADESTPVYYKLTSDINLNDNAWTPIGTAHKTDPFTGVFDGDNHTISGLKVELAVDTSNACAGLFGGADGAVIKNVRVIGSKCFGAYSGGILGYGLNGCKVINCYTKIDHIDGFGVGGVVGRTEDKNSNGEVFGCVSDSKLLINNYQSSKDVFAGGIVGVAGGVTISYCTSNTDITIDHADPDPKSNKTHLLGGILGCQGASSTPATVRFSYSTGTIKGYTAAVSNNVAYAGGIIGRSGHVDGCRVENCFTTVKIIWTATKDATETTNEDQNHYGSVVGQLRRDASFKNCYALSDHFIGSDEGTVPADVTDATVFKALTEDQMKGSEALKNMNLKLSASQLCANAISTALENPNYYQSELKEMEAFTDGKTLAEYMTAFVAANYKAPMDGEVWTTTPGDLPSISNTALAYTLDHIEADVTAMVENELAALYEKVKAATTTTDDEGPDDTTTTPDGNETSAVPDNTTTEAPASDTKNTPSTNNTTATAPSDSGCAGCGGFTAVATLAALLVGSAAFVVVKKKF